MSTTQTIELEIKPKEQINDEVDLEIQSSIPLQSTLETHFELKHSKILILLYITFISLNLIALILQFVEIIQFNLILIINITGGIFLIIWIIYQFRDTHSSIGTYFQRRDLFLPLIFHLMDTSTDLATVYIYYESYKLDKNDLLSSENNESYDITDEEKKFIQYDIETNLQLFIVSILIICSYRIISSIIVYLFTSNIKYSLFQCCDIYIYEILIKSWQYQKMQPTLIQTYIMSLEAYFESFPQFLMGLLYILEVITDPNNIDTSENNNNKILSAILVGFSGILSLMSVAHKARKDDERHFKANRNIRDIHIHCTNNYIICCNWKWFAQVIFRYFDIWLRCYCLMVIWYNTQDEESFIGFGGGKLIIVIILFDFLGSIFVGSIMNKSLNFDFISCIAITPIVSVNNIIIFCWRMIENLLLFICMYYFKSQEDYDENGWIIFVIFSLIGYIYVTVLSIIYAFELFLDWRCCCDVIKTFGINRQTFEGIENVIELTDIIRFGYKLNSNHIKNGDFTEMINIKNIYEFIIDGIAENNKQKEEFIKAWKNINHSKRGTLLHQFCRNIYYENNENLNQLLNILSNKYGNSKTKPQSRLTDKYMNHDSTWSAPYM
eukprot:316427_1